MLLFVFAPTALAAVYWGQSGETVRRVQQKLKQWGYYSGTVDGVFGQGTYDAVIRFQKKERPAGGRRGGRGDAGGNGRFRKVGGLGGDDGGFRLRLGGRAAGAADSRQARGEPYVGMVAVGAVALNRVRSSRFPDTLAGVIYQSGAFDG